MEDPEWDRLNHEQSSMGDEGAKLVAILRYRLDNARSHGEEAERQAHIAKRRENWLNHINMGRPARVRAFNAQEGAANFLGLLRMECS